MVRGVVLVVDAFEGPMPQTKFAVKASRQALNPSLCSTRLIVRCSPWWRGRKRALWFLLLAQTTLNWTLSRCTQAQSLVGQLIAPIRLRWQSRPQRTQHHACTRSHCRECAFAQTPEALCACGDDDWARRAPGRLATGLVDSGSVAVSDSCIRLVALRPRKRCEAFLQLLEVSAFHSQAVLRRLGTS